MATETLTLTDKEYVQITDGTNNAFVSIINWPGYSEVVWGDSPSQPDINASAHDESVKIGFGPPLVVWMKSKRGQSLISITRWSS